MNAIVERIEPVKTVKKPRDVAIGELRGQLRQARVEIRALKRQVKAEQVHSTGMLSAMRHMAALMQTETLSVCRCTPTRAEMIAPKM
jgi:hypothetical protein